ncbi:MAG: transcriptional regulator [Candidatus Aenigmatarchaeota archaeon]
MRKPSSPQEIESWYIIPAIRREFVKQMVKRGLNQKQAADRLGLTDAAVSQYLSDKRGKEVKFKRSIKSEIGKSVDTLLGGGNAMKELQRICMVAKKERLVCRMSIALGCKPKNCKECFE